jgi:hypothetical protein
MVKIHWIVQYSPGGGNNLVRSKNYYELDEAHDRVYEIQAVDPNANAHVIRCEYEEFNEMPRVN